MSDKTVVAALDAAAELFEDIGRPELAKEADQLVAEIVAADVGTGVSKHIYKLLRKCVQAGKSYKQCKKLVDHQFKAQGFELKQDDFDDMKKQLEAAGGPGGGVPDGSGPPPGGKGMGPGGGTGPCEGDFQNDYAPWKGTGAEVDDDILMADFWDADEVLAEDGEEFNEVHIANVLDEDDVVIARRRPIMRTRTKKPKKWLYCEPPERRKTRKGKKYWASKCHYKIMGKGEKVLLINLGYDPQKPQKVEIDGKKIPFKKKKVKKEAPPKAKKEGSHDPFEKQALLDTPAKIKAKAVFNSKRKKGTEAVKKEYLRARMQYLTYKKPGNKYYFMEFRRLCVEAKYSVAAWDKEQKHVSSAEQQLLEKILKKGSHDPFGVEKVAEDMNRLIPDVDVIWNFSSKEFVVILKNSQIINSVYNALKSSKISIEKNPAAITFKG
jgi:hypothetical protein